MADKKKLTPSEKENIIKKVGFFILVAAVGILSAGRIDLSKNRPA